MIPGEYATNKNKVTLASLAEKFLNFFQFFLSLAILGPPEIYFGHFGRFRAN